MDLLLYAGEKPEGARLRLALISNRMPGGQHRAPSDPLLVLPKRPASCQRDLTTRGSRRILAPLRASHDILEHRRTQQTSELTHSRIAPVRTEA